MKKIIMIMVTLLAIATTTKAMTYAQAREQALFLTDKMAYELNLTEEQYEADNQILHSKPICTTAAETIQARTVV